MNEYFALYNKRLRETNRAIRASVAPVAKPTEVIGSYACRDNNCEKFGKIFYLTKEGTFVTKIIIVDDSKD